MHIINFISYNKYTRNRLIKKCTIHCIKVFRGSLAIATISWDFLEKGLTSSLIVFISMIRFHKSYSCLFVTLN